MGMMFRTFVITSAVTFALAGASAAGAQDFGVMESAEIIQPGNFKFTGYPMFVLGEDGLDDSWGVVLRGGYGFNDSLDGELGVAFYDGSTLIGGNLELALLRPPPAVGAVDLSVRGGAHLVQSDAEDALGLDLAGLLSTRLTQNLELVASLDFNEHFYDDPFPDVTTLHLVPGVEYRLSRNLDLLAEFGLGLDDDAANYLSAGLSLYFR
jgi:hypothetical protein